MIYLIRHGQTVGNAARVVQTPDTPLSDHGHWQARQLGKRLAGSGLRRILTSDYHRARQTAAALDPDGIVPTDSLEVLRERGLAGLAGRQYDEVEQYFYGPAHNAPDCETWVDFRARVARLWGQVSTVASGTDGPVAVVTHGLVCKALAEFHLQPAPGEAPLDWFVNASLTEIEPRPPWTVLLAGCAAHLEEQSSARSPKPEA